MNFVKFLRTPFLQNTSGRLLIFVVFNASLLQNFISTEAASRGVLCKNVFLETSQKS